VPPPGSRDNRLNQAGKGRKEIAVPGLEHATDRSGQIAELRRECANRPLEPGNLAAAAEIERWVEMCFNQEYEW